MLSQKAQAHAQACRFCWMCRHLCPVGQATGKEVHTPRAKGLLLSMAARGFDYDQDMAEVVFDCLLCGACSNDCATGYEPPLYIREARAEALVQDVVPEAAQAVIDRLFETGNVYGLPRAEKWTLLSSALGDFWDRADTLLYVGDACAYSQPNMAAAVMGLLNKAGVVFSVLWEEPASGGAMGDAIGYVREVELQAKECAQAINASGAQTVVVLDPHDATAFKHLYPEWGCALEADVVTATAYIARLIAQGRLEPRPQNQSATYHDASPLARDLDEHEPARAILSAMGVSVHEMFLNRRMAKSCGNALFQAYKPELAKQVAAARWEDAKRTPVKCLVTACPQNYAAFDSAVPEGYALRDLFEWLLEAVNG